MDSLSQYETGGQFTNEQIQQALDNNRKRKDLFQLGEFTGAAGGLLPWKVECDSLTDKDIECLCKIIREKFPVYSLAVGVPRGGLRIAEELQKHRDIRSSQPILVVDDVWTTGMSLCSTMEAVRKDHPDNRVVGVVLFSRDRNILAHHHCYALWTLW